MIGLVGIELIPILLISAVVAILLGMELPTPVAYVVMFVTVVPLMIDAGVDIFAANFFASFTLSRFLFELILGRRANAELSI